MKRKTKKIIFSTAAVGLASVLAVGTLLHTSVSVAASSAMMPGIETIVSNTTKEDPLKILEIVDNKNEAEIGYYISGQEPTLKVFQYDTGKTDENGEKIYRSFQSVEEALSVLPTYEARKAFIENRNIDGTDTGIKNISNFCGEDEQTYPLSFSEYQERYFLSGKDNQDSSWKKVDFENGEIRTVDLPGHFEQVNPGEGDYVKDKVKYYPVRSDVASDRNKAKYRENIRGFAYSGEGSASSPYLVDFVPVTNENGTYATNFSADQVKAAYNYHNGQYGYYENIYRELTSTTDFSQMPGEKTVTAAETVSEENAEAAEAFGSPDAFSDAAVFQSGDDFSDEANYSAEPAFLQETEENPMIYRAQVINQYPNYKYTEYNTYSVVREKAQKYPENGILEITDGMITEEANGVYKLWTVDEFGARSEYLYYIQGRQQVSVENVRNLPEDYYPDSFSAENSAPKVMPYYYMVSQYQFACVFKDNDGETGIDNAEKNPDAYQYTGWYYALTPQNEDVYVQTDNDPTYYTSDAEYSLNPGMGEYRFVYDEGEKPVKVQVNHLYYQGGYSNHDWLKRYVFHLNPGDDEFDSFGIDVTTMTVTDFEQYLAKQENASAAEINISDEIASAAEATISDDAFSDKINTFDGITEDTFGDSTGEEGITSEVETIVSQSQEELTSEETNMVSAETDDVLEESALAEGSMNADVFSDTEEPDIFSTGDEDVFSAGNTEASSKSTAISDFDLIYINGSLSGNSANIIAASEIPVIINQSKNTQDSGIATAFADFIKDDSDNHYVNQYIYFFNESDKNSGTSGWLVNLNFHTNFNLGENSEIEGFEEVLKYIESENQYRELGNADFSDNGEEITDGQPSVGKLSTDISQARAIEYILNYKHRRPTNLKSNIHVLEIQPTKSDSPLTEQKVLEWLGYGTDKVKISKISACCWHEDQSADKMLDGDSTTMWSSAYNTDEKNGCNAFDNPDDNKHYVTLELDNLASLTGFRYQARNDSGKKGVLYGYRVQFFDNNGNLIKKDNNGTNIESGITGNISYNWNNIDRGIVSVTFPSAVMNVKTVRLYFDDTFGDVNGEQIKYATCAEIGLLGYDIAPQINRTSMTASEFVGHIDDINSLYDIIYIGDDGKNRNKFINGESPMLYSHVGAGVSTSKNWNMLGRYLGQLDSEYDSGTYDGKKRFAPANTYGETGAGYLRGSGNDMTAQQYEELMEFVKSGYPVVIGSGLISNTGRKVNMDTVDGSSYYYQFLTEALKYDNAIVEAELISQKKNLGFFANLAKPVIKFTDNGKPPEPPRAEGGLTSGETGYIDGELRYTFTLGNDSDVSPAMTTYNCRLYLDLNFDGNLSDKEAQDQYIIISDSSGKILTQTSYGENDGRYELKLGEQYTVTRKIPEDYFKIIKWKLEISNNTNDYIHSSETGYAKQKNKGDLQEINVLQIIPDAGGTWKLKSDTRLKQLLDEVEDFEIKIEEITVSNFAALANVSQKLNEQQILIIGFDDAYQNIPNERGQVNAILDFIRSGKSVIFSHDTTSFQNYNYSEVYPKIARTQYGLDEDISVAKDDWLLYTKKNPSWGLSLNYILRSVVGMDRYGITSDETIDGVKVSSIIKSGHELNSDVVNFQTLMKVAGDIAYKKNDTTRNTSYAQTQAYTNGLLMEYNLGGSKTTSRARKVNDGAITQYPFQINENISVSTTHGQYFQLGLEQDKDINGNSDGKNDIVVWYCLVGKDLYDASPNDVRNYYFYYSKGNVIYTGTGHSAINSDDERKLFINSIVAAANVTAVQPEIHFVKSLNPAAEPESVRYYMTDQTSWVNDAQNILEKDMDFYINVKDYNMVCADLSQEDLDKQEMTLEFYIESDDENAITMDGDDIPTDIKGKKMVSINTSIPYLSIFGDGNKVINIGSDGRFHLDTNTAYGFRINDIEQYLRDDSLTKAYRSNCRVYVKVSSTVYLYGSPKINTSWAFINLKQRQLFDLD